jgi:hypothetical protein
MHFLYVDEAGNTGADLTSVQQPVFVMAALVVSDEKWRKSRAAIQDRLHEFFGGVLPGGFELHSNELLGPNGDGPFVGRSREERNALAIDLLRLIETRGHYVFQVSIYKDKLQHQPSPASDFGFAWKHPWQFAFDMIMTMFEDFLRGPGTGQSSAGLAIVDHEDEYVAFVRAHTARRQSATGWRKLRKVVEIGYSAASHANALIQLTDLVAFTRKKYLELQTGMATAWPDEAVAFFTQCHDTTWPRVRYKNLAFGQLNVHCSATDHAKAIRSP